MRKLSAKFLASFFVVLLGLGSGCETSPVSAKLPVAEAVKYDLQPFVYAKGSLNQEQDNPKAPRIGEVVLALAGDSTVTYNAGYAAGLRACFDPRLQVVNFSHGGSTTASFRADGRWSQVLSLKPDYVMIQFGHNDTAKLDLPTYSANLARFIDEARAAGIKPILVTPVARRYWQADGTIKDDLGPWVAAMQQVAADKNVPLMQLHEKAIELYLKTGRAVTEQWGLPKADPANPGVTIRDKTHFTAEASAAMGRTAADELKRAVPQLGQYIH